MSSAHHSGAVESATSTTDAFPLVVVGAGIGGVATAVSLARRGLRVTVLEQAPEIGEIGAGIQLAPNALRVLDALGALDDVYAHAVFPPAATMRDATTGDVITRLEFGPDFVAKYGYPYIVTHRSDLHSALIDAAVRTGLVDIRTDSRVVAYAQPSEDVVELTLESGHVVQASAVVAADGLHSPARTYVTGGDEVLYAGDYAYRGTVPYDAISERDGKDDMTWWVGPGMHLIQYPVRGGELYNQVAVFTSFQEGDRETWGSADELDRQFADKHEHVLEGVSKVNRDRNWAMVDRAPAATWTRGRVVLLGDAAHPMLQYLAQGGCQALEDADALSTSLALHSDPALAFKHYESIRAPRSGQVQRWARLMGDIVHADGVLADLRDELLRHRAAADLEQVDWLYSNSSATGQDS